MRMFMGPQCLLPLATAAVLLGGTFGCGKAKDALQEQLGVSQLESADQKTLLTTAGLLDATGQPPAKLKDLEVLGGFKLTDKFSQDISTSTKIPVPFLSIDVPQKGQAAAQNQGSLALLKEITFEVEPGKLITRLQIISVAKFNAETKELEISGEAVNQAMDKDQVVSLANKNQAGTYVLIRAKGDKGLMYLTGVAQLQKADGSAKTLVKDAVVFTSESPFVTKTGKEGKYFLAMLEGSKGQVNAYKKTIPAEATGTPPSTTETIGFAGVLDQYKQGAGDKVKELGNAKADAAFTSNFDKINTKVTDFVNGWKIVSKDLVFKQPPQAPVLPASEPKLPPQDLPKKPDATPVTPGEATTVPVIVPTEGTNPDIAREEIADPAYNENLGCDDPDKIIYDGADFDKYTAAIAGWRATGDVRITGEEAEKIFGNPETLGTASSGRYLDQFTGYCLLSTGNQLFKLTEQSIFMPDTSGQITSEMWQTLKMPSEKSGYKSIQLRVAFFSQEFPKFVGTQFNDSFYIKFDEHMDNIGDGDLNRLAGSEDATKEAEVKGCPKVDDPTKKCGEWQFVQAASLSGELFNISSSDEASTKLSKPYKCDKGAKGADGVKCYPGMIPPRTFCANLTADDFGATRTLRVSISDVGDQFFDSALAVDSVVFAKEACGAKGFAGDDKSRGNGL